MSAEEKKQKEFADNAKKKQQAEEKQKEDAIIESRRSIYLFSPFKSNQVTCQINQLSNGMISSFVRSSDIFHCLSDMCLLLKQHTKHSHSH